MIKVVLTNLPKGGTRVKCEMSNHDDEFDKLTELVMIVQSVMNNIKVTPAMTAAFLTTLAQELL